MIRIANILGKSSDATRFQEEYKLAHQEFTAEYTTPNGRLVSDSQTAYALAICFEVLSAEQLSRAGNRLAELVRRNAFKIGTGFAGTPFVCEALALTGHIQVAYAMLLNKECPSWLYSVTMGATTVWERWDSMLSDGSINPGEMTSFNHYAFGSIGKFLHERLAGLRCIKPGWKKVQVAPLIGADFTSASASYKTPFGLVSCSWEIRDNPEGDSMLQVDVRVPPQTGMEIILPCDDWQKIEIDGPCERSIVVPYEKRSDWPVTPINGAPGAVSNI